MINFNPHINSSTETDAAICSTTSTDRWRTDLRMVRSVATPDAADYTYASFIVRDGTPGAVRV